MSAEKSEEHSFRHSKFVRASETLVLDDLSLKHDYIAQRNQLNDLIERLRKATPEEVDAGLVSILTPFILVLGVSDTLDLPVVGYEDKARNKTVDIFKQRYPDFDVHKGRF